MAADRTLHWTRVAMKGGKRTFEECFGGVGFTPYADFANIYLQRLFNDGGCTILAL